MWVSYVATTEKTPRQRISTASSTINSEETEGGFNAQHLIDHRARLTRRSMLRGHWETIWEAQNHANPADNKNTAETVGGVEQKNREAERTEFCKTQNPDQTFLLPLPRLYLSYTQVCGAREHEGEKGHDQDTPERLRGGGGRIQPPAARKAAG